MTIDGTPRRGRNIGHILQEMFFVWLITFLAIPSNSVAERARSPR